jgi:uncharacterized protein YwbE
MRVFSMHIFLLTTTMVIFADDSEPIDLTRSEIEITEFLQGQVVVDLLARKVDPYRSEDTFMLFGPDGFIDTLNCVGAACMPPEQTDTPPKITIGPQSTDAGYPIGIRIPENQLKTGEYIISVVRKRSILHERRFYIVNPQPRISGLTIRNNRNGTFKTIEDTLWVSHFQTYDSMRVQMSGDYLDQPLKSATIQDLHLKQSDTSSALLLFGEEWRSDKIYKLRLGVSDLILRRKIGTAASSRSLFITAPAPRILGNELEVAVSESDSRKEITLNVENIFPLATVELINLQQSPGFLTNPGQLVPGTIDFKAGKLTFTLLFKALGRSNSAVFGVRVKNADGKASNIKQVRVNKTTTNVELAALTSEKPLLAGVINDVRFSPQRGTFASAIGSKRFGVAFDEQNPIIFEADQVSANAITGSFKLSETLAGNKVSYRLFSFDNPQFSRNGLIDGVRPKPIVTTAEQLIYRGGSAVVRLKQATDAYLRPVETNTSITISQPDNTPTKEFIITADANAADFKLQVMLMGHQVGILPFTVRNFPSPSDVPSQSIIGSQYFRQNMMILTADQLGSIPLQIPTGDSGIPANARFAAQLYNDNGSTLGFERTFVPNDTASVLQTTLDFATGLEAGDAFQVKITNPNKDVKTINGYVKKRFIDKIIFTTGISAIEYNLGDADSTGNANIFSGINVGVYYMPEFDYRQRTKTIGFGLNMLIFATDSKPDLKLGASVFLLERFMVGVTYRNKSMRLLLGLDTELADLSAFFGN